jgi:uncharacterized protein (TIGR00251 family)
VSALQQQAAYSSPASAPAEIAIVQAPSWPVSDAEVETLVRQAVTLAGGLEGVVHAGDTVVVKPNAKEDRVEALGPNQFAVRVKAPAVEGRANEAVVALLARHFRVPKSAVTIRAGARSRRKMVEISNLQSQT